MNKPRLSQERRGFQLYLTESVFKIIIFSETLSNTCFKAISHLVDITLVIGQPRTEVHVRRKKSGDFLLSYMRTSRILLQRPSRALSSKRKAEQTGGIEQEKLCPGCSEMQQEAENCFTYKDIY